MRSVIMAVIFLAFPAYALGANIYVPGTYSTIQAGIDAAVNGDTVFVSPGTYHEVINFKGKAITVKGTGGAHGVIIDGNQWLSVVTFNNGEGPSSVLEGFTITNGSGSYLLGPGLDGGGILCHSASPTIRSNVITGNGVSGKGGGIYGYAYSSPVVENNFIHNNTAGAFGAGIYCYYYCSPVIRDNHIYQNATTGVNGGGGLAMDTGCTPFISKNRIYWNASQAGGAFFCQWQCNATFENNFICGNTAVSQGGALWCDGSAITLMNDSFHGNAATGFPGQGGAVYIQNSNASLQVINTILWNDTAATGFEIYMDWGVPVQVSYSTVQGDQGGVHAVSPWSLAWGTGNLNFDPKFLQPVTPDLYITHHSPCINMGTAAGAPSDDINGTPRPYMGMVDMGACECAGPLALEGDILTLSEASGGVVNFALDAGTAFGGRSYFLLGSVTGYTPGFSLPSGLRLPMNWDLFTKIVFQLTNTTAFAAFNGTLDAAGKGNAQFNTLGPLPPGTAGLVMHYAYLLYGPYDLVSNPVPVTVAP